MTARDTASQGIEVYFLPVAIISPAIQSHPGWDVKGFSLPLRSRSSWPDATNPT
jgi:hypothetical protein